jgi:uncharacterized membrane protein YhaH (DUF805 family)
MFQNPFSFQGRIRRTEYVITIIIYFVIMVVINLTIQSEDGTSIAKLANIPMLWFLWAQGAKRCHDRDNSGWYQIIPFYLLWMLFADSVEGVNEYGYNPKAK